MKTQKHRNKLKTELQQNYNICQMLIQRQGVNSGSLLISYEQFMYLLFNGRIPMTKIAYYRNKYYQQQPLFRKTFIIQDAIKLNQQIINKAWRFQRSTQKIKNRSQSTKSIQQNLHKNSYAKLNTISNQNQEVRQENKQQTNQNQHQTAQKKGRVQKPQSKSKLRSSLRKNYTQNQQQEKLSKMKHVKKIRIQQIKQSLNILQTKINATKDQQMVFQYQNQYNKLSKQLTFLRNQKRIQKQQKLIKKIQQENSSKVSNKLQQILQQLNQIKTNRAKKLKRQQNFKQKFSKTQQLNRLKLIFNFYCKKQIKPTNSGACFSDLEKSIDKLNLQIFLKFVQDWNINRILSIQKIVNIFKRRSKGTRSIDILQFNQVLVDIHGFECIQQQKPITNQSKSQYMQQYIVCDKKINKFVLNSKLVGQSKTENIRILKTEKQNSIQENKQLQNNENSKQLQQQQKAHFQKINYKFKPRSHSGKYLQDIKMELEAKKKTINFLAGPQNLKIIQEKLNKNLRTISNQRIQTQNNQLNAYNPSKIQSMNSSSNSYAFKFKLRNKKKIKTQGVTQYLNIQSVDKKNLKNSDENNRQNIYIRNLSKSRYDQNEVKKNKKLQNDSLKNSFLLRNEQKQQPQQSIASQNTSVNINYLNYKNKGGRGAEGLQGLQQLIDQSQQDEYLKKHILPPINPKRSNGQIHY